MIKICILTIVFLHFCFSTRKYAEGARKDSTANDRLYKEGELKDGTGNLEENLHHLHSLLRDPVDEEHDILDSESDTTHADEWTIQIDTNDEKAARALADKYGFETFSKVGVGDGVFRFLKIKDTAQNSINEEDVIDAEKTSKSEKREDDKKDDEKRESLLQNLAERLTADQSVRWYKRERILKREKRVPIEKRTPDRHVTLSDPEFPKQWYIKNDGQTTGPAKFDSNIVPVWNMGYTGKGVTISVLDDGMDHSHPDLSDNYDADSSTDLNGNDNDPMPNDSDPYNAHGTKCSGTIAAKANNSLCGVGIAYDAKVGAIRMLDGKATDGLEANALSFHRDHIDIYSCSWGPKDNGKTFGRPGTLGRIAFAQGAIFGRKGLGSLFVWATGNGGQSMDDCNADGYVNSIYTMGIGSVNEHGVSTYYGEKCSAMFAVTYCSGRHSNVFVKNAHADVITTYLHHKCTEHFVGTSSAAPLAAGILALVLEANPKLTWRDVQHLLFHTTKVTSPLDSDWQKNGCGKNVNHKFGFGLLDAYGLVNAALNWTNVPKQRTCHFNLNFKNGDIPSRRHFKLNFTTDGCQNSCHKKMDDGKCKNAITKLEHVVVDVTLKHRRRGDLSIALISPFGTVSQLLRSRIHDGSSAGLKGWKFMTVFNWCENPSGTWQLVFQDNEPWHKETTRDYEEVYINYLDTKKRAQEMKRAQRSRIKKGSGNTLKDETRKDYSVDAQVEKQRYDNPQKSGDTQKESDDSSNTSEGVVYKANDAARTSDKSSDNKKDESEEYADKYYNGDRYQREENDRYHDDLYRRHYETDDRYDYKRRRREAVKKFGIDEEHERTLKPIEEVIEYDDPILEKSELAGVVESISVTFYGTA